MLNVSGVGANKFGKYGQRFLDEISSYQMAHPDTVIRILEEEETEPAVQTEKGQALGIQSVDKISQSGFSYTSLMYPPKVQKKIVHSFVAPRGGEDLEK